MVEQSWRFVVVAGLIWAALALPMSDVAATPEASASDWTMVSAGGNHSCGIRAGGRMYCWGLDDFGQLGNDGSNTSVSDPVEVAGGFTDWVGLATGSFHTCGRRTTGQLYCWGNDGDGRLGDGGGVANTDIPVEVAGAHTDWRAVTAGVAHTCARRATGRLYCWGNDLADQLGNGAAVDDQFSPVEVFGARTDWAGVSAGGFHTCARRQNQRLFCWGDDGDGQQGDGGVLADNATPAQVAGFHADWTSVSAGADHTCGRRATGRLYCWGDDSAGQLGTGGILADEPVPTEVAGRRTDWSSASAGGSHTCGRRTTGRLFCWGDDGDGQVGDNAAFTDRTVPFQVQGGATDWRQVDAGGSHTCARITTGRLYCWGDDGNGQIGDFTPNADRPTPVQVWT